MKALGDRLQAQLTGIPPTPGSSALQPWCTGELCPMTLRSLLDVVKNFSVRDSELEISWMNDVRHSSVHDSEHLTIMETVIAVWEWTLVSTTLSSHSSPSSITKQQKSNKNTNILILSSFLFKTSCYQTLRLLTTMTYKTYIWNIWGKTLDT